ncbi:MAG TPA: hypothetical protein VEX18_17365, partial [Polyangiaceae bacterium]|nr:hypothetical protein [Polyangiaceae bacterium]
MTLDPRFNDRDVIERYTDQPARLPDSVRRLLGRADPLANITCYALSDLGSRLTFANSWLVLTTRELVVARQQPGGAFELLCTPHQDIRKVDLSTGLSCHVLRVLGADDTPLVELRFTHRQRRSMEGMSFFLEQLTKGIAIEPRDPDATYLDSVAQPIREAQALVSTGKMAVVWRLLSYL